MIDHLLNTTVTVYRPGFASDGRGGRTSSASSVGTVRAKVGQPSPAEGRTAGRDGATLTHVVHVPYGADVRRGDLLDVGGPRRLRVVDVVTNSWRSYWHLDCEVVQGAG